ncbi:MAG: ferredoxin [Bacilli bacterium]|nr:ferredoxin [Bacilli bacterium]
MAKVEVDKEKCIGCGACTAVAPDVFEFDDDGLAKAVKNEINDDVKNAAEGCPTEAITVEE